MEEILKEISNSKLTNNIDIQRIIAELKKYYDTHNRHKYSEVSRFIFNLDESQIDVIAFNLKLIIENIDNEPNITRNIEKLIDHTDLALFQKKYIEDQNKKNKLLLQGIYDKLLISRKELLKTEVKLKEELLEIRNNFNSIEENIDKHKSSVYTHFVTILGIFTAIAFGVFGGMEILGGVMSNIVNVKISKLLMFSSLIIGAILTILYMLLTGISNLVGSPLRSCGCEGRDECNHSPFQRHPIYFSGLISSLYLFLIGTIAHGFETKNFKGILFIDEFMDDGFSLILVAIILLIFIFLFAFFVNKYLQNKELQKREK